MCFPHSHFDVGLIHPHIPAHSLINAVPSGGLPNQLLQTRNAHRPHMIMFIRFVRRSIIATFPLIHFLFIC